MILKYEVIKNGQVVHSGGASSEAEVHEQLKPYYEHKTFGEPERTIQVVVSDYVPASYDEEGVELTPAVEAVYEDVVIPAEYEVVITDITLQSQAIEQIAEAKAYLASTDYMAIREFEGGEPMPVEIKNERASKRALINSLEAELP